MAECASCSALSRLVGRRVVDVRVGRHGFDLVLDDGSEVEFYTICDWVAVHSSRRWVRVDSYALAEELAAELVAGGIDASVVVDSNTGAVYVSVSEEHYDRVKELCASGAGFRVCGLIG